MIAQRSLQLGCLITRQNPIIFVDPNGEDIVIYYKDQKTGVPGYHTYNPNKEYKGNDSFVKQVYQSLNYLSEGSETAKGVINSIASNKDFEVTIEKTDKLKLEYDSRGDYLFYNPESGLMTDDGIQSAAVGLIHELGHTKNVMDEGEGAANARNGEKDAQYDNKEEKKVITEVEQPVVKELNANGANEAIRYNHKGTEIKTACPTCNY